MMAVKWWLIGGATVEIKDEGVYICVNDECICIECDDDEGPDLDDLSDCIKAVRREIKPRPSEQCLDRLRARIANAEE